MGVKKIRKKASASIQIKAKQISSLIQEDDNNETKSFLRGGQRVPRQNYYESDNSCVDDTDADSDFEQTASQNRQCKRKMDNESSSDKDKILIKAKMRKAMQVSVKKKIQNAKKRKFKKDSSDSGNSSDESEASRNKNTFGKNYQPLLSSEGSDSDVPIAKSCTKQVNTLESKLSHKVDEIKEPVTSFKLINKNIDVDENTLENKDLNIKMNYECQDGVWEKETLEDNDEDVKKVKVKIEPDNKLITVKEKKDFKEDKPSVKEKKVLKKSAATIKGKTQSKAPKCELKEDKEEDSGTREMSTRNRTKSKSTKSVVAKKEKYSKIKDLNDVSSVLMQFEGKKSVNKRLSDDEDYVAVAENSSESDWEEVEDDPSIPSTSTSKPQQAIEITLEQKQFVKKKKRVGGFDWKAFFRRQINVFQRELQIAKHKVNLLCLIGHGMVLNRSCCDPVLKALAFSLFPPTDKSDFTVGKIKNILTTFSTTVQITTQENDAEVLTYSSIVKSFFNCRAQGTKEYTMMVVMALRSLGLRVRFVMSLHPIPLKEPKEDKKTQNSMPKNIQKEKTVAKKNNDSKNRKVTKKESTEKKKNKMVKSTQNKFISEKKYSQTEDDSTVEKKNRPSRKKSQNISYKESDESDFEEENKVPEKKLKICKKTLASKVSEKMSSSSSPISSDDFEEESIKFTSSKRTESKADNKIISSSSSNASFADNQEKLTETWIEVYLEKEKRWLSVDCVNMVFDDVSHFENLDSRPLTYILSFDNDGYLKDVTPRYSSQWMLKTRKLRVQEEWWEKTMKPYLKIDEDNEREDTQIQDNLLKQPLPKTISEYKNHPLYVLKRHLLKFEAIYPNSAVPLGYIKNEPIYARECVHQLHARETWMKDGRNVKVGEEPYKMVKSRPKWNKPKENPDIPDLPVFGIWQTEIYVPPPAINGKIPRNEYGNVELYKPSMLPGGTVHLKEPGLNRIARKLGVDCAAAMVGWDFHGGSSHPVFDGWIVCVEHEDMILKEWEKDQERTQLKEIEKREKRIYGNWKKLTRGLLIKERLKKKYDLTEPESIEDEEEEAKDSKLSWLENCKKKNKKNDSQNKERKKIM